MRLSIIIGTFITYRVFCSGCWLGFKLFFVIIIVRQLILIYQFSNPCLPYIELSCVMNEWRLLNKNGNIERFDSHKVLFNSGLFFLLELRSDARKKRLLIFFDQLYNDEFRKIKLMEKIKPWV